MATDKKSFGQRLQDFMSSYRGKVIMNYAYSWGAAIVIAGTLFKLTHLPGANFMLWVGMGTEVLVFFLSAFDLPRKHDVASESVSVSSGKTMPVQVHPANQSVSPIGAVDTAGGVPVSHSSSLNTAMEMATQAYIDKLKETTEMLDRFAEQASSLTQDAEQMQHLNKNLAGINAIYEMQLRSTSAQIGTIDQVHEETRKMARQIEELNALYARMLQAMQVKNA
jgi:hypothetical protein